MKRIVVTGFDDSAKQRAGPLRIGAQKQLFVDDYVIGQMEGARVVFHPAQKHRANPMMTPEHSWEGDEIRVYGTVLFDEQEQIFKMWYVRSIWKGAGAVCYATSSDGVRWHRPNLGLVDCDGSTDNNHVPGSGHTLGVIDSPDEADASRRYKALAGRRGTFSPDGLRWTTPPEAQDIPGEIASDNVIPVCCDEIGERYVAFPKMNAESAGHLRRAVGLSTSKDFLNWTPAETVYVPDERDDELARARIERLRDRLLYVDGPEWHLAQFYGLCGFPYEGIYLGLLWVFDISGWPAELERKPAWGGEDGVTQVELVCSRDLRRWRRVGDRELLIAAGPKGAWDGGLIHTTNRPVIKGDEIWIYYSGADRGHRKTVPPYRSGIGVAKLRRDGWVSIEADERAGTLMTKALVFEGNKLVINAAAPGSVAVEVLDERGRALAGYGKQECARFTGDAVRHTVKWAGREDVGRLSGRPVRLRCLLERASLYSFQFRDE